MRAICLAESSGKQYATGYNSDGSVDKGLFQINSCHANLIGDRDIYDNDVNIQIAYQIWQGKQGYNAWSTFNNKRYLKYL